MASAATGSGGFARLRITLPGAYERELTADMITKEKSAVAALDVNRIDLLRTRLRIARVSESVEYAKRLRDMSRGR